MKKLFRNRLKAKAAAAVQQNLSSPTEEAIAYSSSINKENKENDLSIYGSVKEEFIKQPFKNAELAYKEAMNLISQEDWEKKCHAMNMIRRLSLYHEDLTANNVHAIVLALIPEVIN